MTLSERLQAARSAQVAPSTSGAQTEAQHGSEYVPVWVRRRGYALRQDERQRFGAVHVVAERVFE